MHQGLSFLAWHYTTGARFLQMLKDRAIVPMASGDALQGRPVIWFSVNDDFEPSACPVARETDGSARHCSVNETAERGQGLVRLGLPVRTLLTCAELRQKSMMSQEAWDELCADARAAGSDPDQWFGRLQRVPLRECVVEVRDEDGLWRRMQGASGATHPHVDSAVSGARRVGPHHLVGR